MIKELKDIVKAVLETRDAVRELTPVLLEALAELKTIRQRLDNDPR